MGRIPYVDQEKCTGCGACAEACIVSCENDFELGMGKKKAAYIPFPQAVPSQYTIDMNHCIQCGICAEVCPVGTIYEK